jgi:hypothetical protein
LRNDRSAALGKLQRMISHYALYTYSISHSCNAVMEGIVYTLVHLNYGKSSDKVIPFYAMKAYGVEAM